MTITRRDNRCAGHKKPTTAGLVILLIYKASSSLFASGPSPIAQNISQIPPQTQREASWMTWSASNYGLFNLIVDFNIINTRKGQIGVVPAELAFSSFSAIPVLALSHPAAQQCLLLISWVSPYISPGYIQRTYLTNMFPCISQYVSFAYIRLIENLHYFWSHPTSFKALSMLLHCFLGLSVLGKYEGMLLS